MRRRGGRGIAALAGLLLLVAGAGGGRAEDVAEPVGKAIALPSEPGPHWFWLSDVLLHRAALFDGDGGELLGTITSGSVGVGFAIVPLRSRDGREIYLAESYFSRGVRGERTDVVTAYDARTLAPIDEIAIPPKRAEYFPGVASSALSDDGRFIAVFNVTPAQSLTIADLEARRFTAEVQTPGCSLVYPAGPRRFFMLCADGGALVVALDEKGTQPRAARTSRFFDADKDPLHEGGARRGRQWLFASFEGVLHTVDASGEEVRLGEGWPLFTDADRQESWRIGGGQPLAVHAATGRLYALVHRGGRDTHKEAGHEVWVYDLAARKRVQRIAVANPLVSFLRLQASIGGEGLGGRFLSWALELVLPNTGANSILVTQDDRPALVVMAEIPPAVTVHDAITGEVVREIGEPGIAGSLLLAP